MKSTIQKEQCIYKEIKKKIDTENNGELKTNNSEKINSLRNEQNQ